jgi:hypothetical protein
MEGLLPLGCVEQEGDSHIPDSYVAYASNRRMTWPRYGVRLLR